MKKRLRIRKITLRDLDRPWLDNVAGGIIPTNTPTCTAPGCGCPTGQACKDTKNANCHTLQETCGAGCTGACPGTDGCPPSYTCSPC